jgi:D-alanyl-D-alanine dipeptidase
MPARTLLIALTVVLAGSLCASASAADLVDVRRYASSIQVDVRYATANNFTGAPLAGGTAISREEQPQPRKHGRPHADPARKRPPARHEHGIRRVHPPGEHHSRARAGTQKSADPKNAMEDQSFVNYFREWWHFDSAEPATRRLDVAIGC